MTRIIILGGVGVFLISLLLTPVVLAACYRFRLFDLPGARKVHRGERPRLGGLAIFVGSFLGILFIATSLEGISLNLQQLIAFLLGAVLFFALGLADDVRGLPAGVKLPLQIVFALGVAVWGVRIDTLFGTVALPLALSLTITVIWIVGIVNAINFIDGLDGLAAGISTIALLAILVISMSRTDYFFALIALVIVAALLGFLPYNFFPARIFLGDGGALLLGYYLATLSILGFFKQTAIIAFVLPILVLSIPIADTTLAIVRRLLRGQSPARADMKHIHHRLLLVFSRRARMQAHRNGRALDALTQELVRGQAHRNAVLWLWGLSTLFALAATYLGTRPPA
ncbi:MAG: hypothetical protein B1H03_02420 [Planctomycetales bacterium 4484_113]|nr:MAG: hypothetical protein B1H03_02420 [Planctomycetales bacterium 4484_113]